MTTWKVGDGWISFGEKRTVGISGGKLASKQECFAVNAPKVSKPKVSKPK